MTALFFLGEKSMLVNVTVLARNCKRRITWNFSLSKKPVTYSKGFPLEDWEFKYDSDFFLNYLNTASLTASTNLSEQELSSKSEVATLTWCTCSLTELFHSFAYCLCPFSEVIFFIVSLPLTKGTRSHVHQSECLAYAKLQSEHIKATALL